MRNNNEKETSLASPERRELARVEEAHVGPTPCLSGLGQVIRPAVRWQITQALNARECYIFHKVFPRLSTAFKKLGPKTDGLLPLYFSPEKKKAAQPSLAM